MFKRTTKDSLRARLIIILSGICFLIWSIATGFEWIKFRKEMNKLFDTQLVLFAERLASSNIMQGFHEINPLQGGFHQKHVDDDALAFAVFTSKGEAIFNDGRDGKFIRFTPHKGFQNTRLIEDDDSEDEVDEWRLFWLQYNDIYIAVGQETEYRNDLINDVMAAKYWGTLIILPLFIFAIWFIVTFELRSLRQLTHHVIQRKPDETMPIEIQNLPPEIIPLVQSLNNYFKRSQSMFNRERRFTSDAAHELRSPLAGLRLQTEIAQMTVDSPDEHKIALDNLISGIDRITQLIEQLLTLSRLENLKQLDDLEPVDWKKLIDSTVTQLYAKAENKHSDIRVEIFGMPKNQQGKKLLLNLVLLNLVGNAINYTPEGSLIRITLSEKNLTVEDNGSYISDEDIAKLGQPFYRPAERPVHSKHDEKGSGLGISITKRIVQLHRFSLQLSRSQMGGLKAEIIF